MHYKKNLIISLVLIASVISISCKRIPAPSGRNRAVVSKTSSEYYTISKGDTLFSISKQFNASIDYLQKVNNIKNPNFLHIGQKIYVGKKEIKLDSSGDIKKDKKIVSNNKNTKVTKINKDKPNSNVNIKNYNVKAFIIMPSNGEILYKFNDMKNGIRVEGIEIKNNKDTFVKATASGDIVYVDEDEKNKILIIDHKNNFYTVYSDLKKVTVKMGDIVKGGEVIGSTEQGKSFYFELKRFQNENNPVAVNPDFYILQK
ncbi:MAG: M23 family metallopeptidase [Candidatus Muirbacterium halophilum]|nr:M23 family metallopeptidase [Candidatus Muirbacterium halophilum]